MDGELGFHLTQRHLGRVLLSYQVVLVSSTDTWRRKDAKLLCSDQPIWVKFWNYIEKVTFTVGDRVRLRNVTIDTFRDVSLSSTDETEIEVNPCITKCRLG